MSRLLEPVSHAPRQRKGVLGIQFALLFKDKLSFRLARRSNNIAAEVSSCLVNLGFKLWQETDSDQVFVISPFSLVEVVLLKFDFFTWETLQDGSWVM